MLWKSNIKICNIKIKRYEKLKNLKKIFFWEYSNSIKQFTLSWFVLNKDNGRENTNKNGDHQWTKMVTISEQKTLSVILLSFIFLFCCFSFFMKSVQKYHRFVFQKWIIGCFVKKVKIFCDLESLSNKNKNK